MDAVQEVWLLGVAQGVWQQAAVQGVWLQVVLVQVVELLVLVEKLVSLEEVWLERISNNIMNNDEMIM